jgi:hypothetical protein
MNQRCEDQVDQQSDGQAVDQLGGSLSLYVDSYTCPADSLCVTAVDHGGYPLQYPELYAFTGGGAYVDYNYSSSHGYVELPDLPAGTYNVDLAGYGTYIVETGWGLGHHSVSAASLPYVDIGARDIVGNPTIDGDVYIRRSHPDIYGVWVGWFNEGPSEVARVYLTPGTYDFEVKDWWDQDYLLSKASQTVSGGETILLDASQMGYDTLNLHMDQGFDWMYNYVRGLVFYAYRFYAQSNPHTIYVSNTHSTYFVDAELGLKDGLDTWYYYLYDGCIVTGAPGVTKSCSFGGTFSTTLETFGDPYMEGDTGFLSTTTEDGYGSTLGYVDHYDADGVTVVQPSEKVHLDPRQDRSRSAPLDKGVDQASYSTVHPQYEVRDALGFTIPVTPLNPWYGSTNSFDIPNPANTGTWQGDVTVDLGPYQADLTDSVSFNVDPIPPDPDNVGFYVPSKYRWYFKNNQTDGWGGVTSFGWGGVSELQPVVGDWDGDGVVTAGFYKPSQYKWFLKHDQNDGWSGVTNFNWGGAVEMIPIAGDWDGDGDDTVGFYKPSTAEWYLKNDNTPGWSGFTKVIWGGAAGNIPIVGDWDGDGDDTIGFFVPSSNKWWLKNNLADGWSGVTGFSFGTAAPMDPVTGDWDADGVDTVGGYVASKWRWFLKDDQVTGWSSVSNFKFGVTVGYEVVAGDWQ